MKIENKRGNVHIDWVISISIFLTYIIVLLAFIKPSYEPSFEGDVLVNMVKNNFDDETNWEVYKSLLSFDCDGGGNKNIDGSLNDYIPDVGNFKIVNEKRNELGDYVLAKYKEDLVIHLATGDDKFWIFHNEFESYDESPQDPGEPQEGIECSISAANPILFNGLSKRKLDNLNVSKIEEKFPEFRQFKISVLSSKGELKDSYCYVKGREDKLSKGECDQITPPTDGIVYGVNLGDAILDKDGNLVQVILNIQVW